MKISDTSRREARQLRQDIEAAYCTTLGPGLQTTIEMVAAKAIEAAYQDGVSAAVASAKLERATKGALGDPTKLVTLRVKGEPFRCDCKGNVFRQLKGTNTYECNACQAWWTGSVDDSASKDPDDGN